MSYKIICWFLLIYLSVPWLLILWHWQYWLFRVLGFLYQGQGLVLAEDKMWTWALPSVPPLSLPNFRTACPQPFNPSPFVEKFMAFNSCREFFTTFPNAHWLFSEDVGASCFDIWIKTSAPERGLQQLLSYWSLSWKQICIYMNCPVCAVKGDMQGLHTNGKPHGGAGECAIQGNSIPAKGFVYLKVKYPDVELCSLN